MYYICGLLSPSFSTRSSKRTSIAYFPINLILKQTLMVWTDRQAGIGMKDRYLTLIFQIVLLESSEVETNALTTGGRKIVQTENRIDRRKQFIKYRNLVRYLSNKKKIKSYF